METPLITIARRKTNITKPQRRKAVRLVKISVAANDGGNVLERNCMKFYIKATDYVDVLARRSVLRSPKFTYQQSTQLKHHKDLK